MDVLGFFRSRPVGPPRPPQTLDGLVAKGVYGRCSHCGVYFGPPGHECEGSRQEQSDRAAAFLRSRGYTVTPPAPRLHAVPPVDLRADRNPYPSLARVEP